MCNFGGRREKGKGEGDDPVANTSGVFSIVISI